MTCCEWSGLLAKVRGIARAPFSGSAYMGFSATRELRDAVRKLQDDNRELARAVEALVNERLNETKARNNP